MKASRFLTLRHAAYRPLYISNCYSTQTTVSENSIIKSQLSHIPLPNLSIDQFLLRNANKWHDRTGVVCSETGRSITFGEYQKFSENLAQILCAKLGFKKGDVIAVLLPNVPEYMTIYLGCFKAGIIITTINPVYTPDEIARQMINCSAKAIITLTQYYSVAENSIKKLQTNTKIPVITIKHQKTDATPSGAIDFKELCEYNGPQVKLESSTIEDTALLPYSSGTSGLPKGVRLVHKNVVADLVQLQHDLIKLTYDTTSSHQDVVPVMAPLYHCYGMIPILFNVFSEGCKSILMPKYRPNLYLNMMEKYQGNLIHIVPPIMIMLCNNEDAKRKHLESIRHVVSAAAPLASSDIERFKEKFGRHINVSQYYGLTETGPVTHAQRTDRDYVPGSVGWVLPLMECKIVDVDDETKNFGPNKEGHLLLRGPNIMPGYHNNPKATAETFDKDGWFKSGDIAYYDENGVFFITDRMKELIKVKGLQVAPAELEALIRDHPQVDDAAVIGISHPQHGEVPKAYVVPRKDSNLKPKQVQEYVKEKAAKHKQLTGGVVFVDSIPKNPSGKIMRRLLKNL